MYKHLYRIHRKYAPDGASLEMVWNHCLIVATIAQRILEQRRELRIDKELVITTALLHDIGVYHIPHTVQGRRIFWDTTLYITHGMRGGDIVRQEGFDEHIAHAIEHHIGVGISREEILQVGLPLPTQDFIPTTLEEKLVAYADNFHSKVPQFNDYEQIKKKLSGFWQGNDARLEEMAHLFGIPRISSIKKHTVQSHNS